MIKKIFETNSSFQDIFAITDKIYVLGGEISTKQ